MKVETAITSLKVEKGCVNMDCKYCTEKVNATWKQF